MRPLTRATAKQKGGKIQTRDGDDDDDDDEFPPSRPPDTARPTRPSAKKKGGKIHSGRGGQRKRPPELLGEKISADVQSFNDDGPDGLPPPYKSAYLEQQGKFWKTAKLHRLVQEAALPPSRIANGGYISQRKSPHEFLGEMGTADEQGGERRLKEYQMVGVDAHVEYSMAAPPPMEDEGGENKKKDPLEVVADEQGGERVLKEYQMMGVDAHVEYSMAAPPPMEDEGGENKKKDPPEVVGVNTQDDEVDSRLKDPRELLGETVTVDEQVEVRTMKDHQMVGVDAHVVISPPLADVIGDQWNASRKKIVFGGILYTCNKVIGDNTKKGNAITKYYCCGMVLFNGEGERWKPLQLPKDVPNIKPDTTSTKCKGALHGTYTMVRGVMKYSFRPGNVSHICHNPTWVHGNTLDTREPLVLIVPSVH